MRIAVALAFTVIATACGGGRPYAVLQNMTSDLSQGMYADAAIDALGIPDAMSAYPCPIKAFAGKTCHYWEYRSQTGALHRRGPTLVIVLVDDPPIRVVSWRWF